jgi:serine/threonine protein kinase
MIGKQLLNYKIVSLIGEGGMGNVYLGEHMSIGRKVAIKVLRPELASNEEIRSRFKNEASVMARLQHPGIVSLFDYVENDDGLFLIMEYVEGIEITDLLKALDEPLSIDRAKDIMKKVLSAFSFAHKNKIVHRDVKPSNILISSDNEVKVLDFGIAKLVGDSQFNLTKTGTQVGTVFYMSPEQVKAKELDQRSDIYSLGITFYELLAGFCPYKGTTSEYEVYDKIVREPLLPLTETLGEQYAQVWGVIKKATEKEPGNRFQTCEEFIAALDTEVPKEKIEKKVVQAKEEVKASPTTMQTPASQPRKKSMVWLFIVLSLVVIVSILLAVQLLGNDEVRDDSVNSTGPIERDQPISEDLVKSTMNAYYRDINNDNFNANDYYASQVKQFITKSNITTTEIMNLRIANSEFLNTQASMNNSSIQFSHMENNDSYWTYWIDFQCYRKSKRAIQTCQTQIEVGFNQDKLIVSYRELQVKNLKFESY